MPREKSRRQLQLETDMYKVFLENPRADEMSAWRNPRTGAQIPWCRKALDIFHLYAKIKAQEERDSDRQRTLRFEETRQTGPQLHHGGLQPE